MVETAAGVTKVVPPASFWGAVYAFNSWSFLHHMGLVFVLLTVFMLGVARLRPLARPREMPGSGVDVSPHPRQYIFGGAVILLTVFLYFRFWSLPRADRSSQPVPAPGIEQRTAKVVARVAPGFPTAC